MNQLMIKIILLVLLAMFVVGCEKECKKAGEFCSSDNECCSGDCIGIPCEPPDQCIISPHCSYPLKKLGEYCSSDDNCEKGLVCKPKIIENVSTFGCDYP